VDSLRRTFVGPEGLGGRVVASWVLAGGICGGGLLIGALAVLGIGSPGLHLLVAPVLFLAGTVLGLVLGLVLAVLGRPASATRGRALRAGLFAAGISLLLLPPSWLVSCAIVVGAALRMEMRISWLAVSLGGSVVGLLACAWAGLEGWRAVSAMLHRRADARDPRLAAASPHPRPVGTDTAGYIVPWN
jgi:hypothetical protein